MGGSSNTNFQRVLGGAQTAAGAAMLATGNPMGAMMLVNGVNSAASPNPQEGPLTAGLNTAQSSAGAMGGPQGGQMAQMMPQISSLLNRGQQQPPAPQAPPMPPRMPSPPPAPMASPPPIQVAGAGGQSPQLQQLLALLQGGGMGMA